MPDNPAAEVEFPVTVPPKRAGELLVLGIETSCDETAAAVLSGAGSDGGHAPETRLLSNIVLSQIEEHAAFGGVVPEIAARAHVAALDGIIKAALQDAGVELPDLDAIAVTAGPGLIGGLMAGFTTAKALAFGADLPLLPINHLEGHALTARMTHGLAFPYLLLLVSGGHTQIVLVRGVGDYERVGTTIDDALGEAFDKTAKLLGLPYPGGPNVEKAALAGDGDRFPLPRPLKGTDRPDFSFSGLKTAVRQAAQSVAPLSEKDVADLCASFQAAVRDTLSDRVGRALDRFARDYPSVASPVLVVAGGVAANSFLRNGLEALCREKGFWFVAPPLALCTDNGAMIAHAGMERLLAGLTPDPEAVFAMAPRSRWPLDESATPVVGSGKRGAKA
ncbi:tRNA (adenosine(37)-N6)-threonylcarbamoyltransferase complex transferase subunit TsaD [Notoacmeibacter sp. MSK16QG-6]|uniref:tRNA (adenosine(37)-N6)-threonylcarbamoyltransferase complex transferase subunit TsaD n=1 Tax=Notoacmeibacter sp. MSK16QG-6 TaxID=2957982 RepID=UPI00209CB231|nr:tRNA (adenosine(37)-N6)-threonylcarbamoyltransferase complex transferase subunit TsaD [Notoacmeibacter sp. MSK16QG-6]MCP1199249.1 tRNA (adenosine(37)-N6)-threonylcarbamoyltransferase complex transferase subunit TsaD [Notoacmeibacter sp. MSK16QG-6]